ncbi:ANTAR domain-containing protein [Sinomonas mesophila]|uniref:ANTAR domain-containing protein n=1 Tax=Sinomonas mesophila TaxID=1531955 RepID=UPI0009866249|nr:ANTAR domain-containing protein [Sinomonas mesophila]
MAARPAHHPAAHELIHLLLATSDLPPLMAALAHRTHVRLAPLGRYQCGIVLQRRNQPTLTAASNEAFEASLQERLTRKDPHLGAVFGGPASSHAHPAPEDWGAQDGHGLLVVPAPAGRDARGAVAVVGEVPTRPAGRRELLAAIGRLRNETSWALHLAVRYAAERERAENRAKAMLNRTVIDMAIGVIMARSQCSTKEAFDALKRASNNRNVKLRDVAAEIVQHVHPSPPQTVFAD